MVENQRRNCLLDLSSNTEIEKYEHALYRAFAREIDDGWNRICDVDGKLKRIRMKIPYENQRIFLVKSAGMISVACAINVAAVGLLQLEALGFKINRDQKGICETLVFFTFLGPMESISIMREFFDFLTQGLKEVDSKVMYATCSEKFSKGYKIMGFTEVDSLMLDGKKEILLIKDVDAPPMI